MSVEMDEYKLSYDNDITNISINGEVVGNIIYKDDNLVLNKSRELSELEASNVKKILKSFGTEGEALPTEPYIQRYPHVNPKKEETIEELIEIKKPNYTVTIITLFIVAILGFILQIGIAIFFVWLPFMIWAGFYALRTEDALSRITEDYDFGRVIINTVKGPFFIYKYYKTFGTLGTSVLN